MNGVNIVNTVKYSQHVKMGLCVLECSAMGVNTKSWFNDLDDLG